jgi:hypothetical protein
VELPAPWLRALTLVADTARQADVPYAIVGTLGIALSQGLDFEPLRPAYGSTGVREPRDLDVFLVAPESARERFRNFLDRAERRSLPQIDIVPIYHAQIQFSPNEGILRYRTIVVPVDARLFTIFEVDAGALRLPVLHPRTHLHMMGQNTPGRRKIRWNMRRLWKRPREDVGFPDLSERHFRAFHHFKRAKLHRYPARYLLMVLRAKLYDRELDGERGLLLATKQELRRLCPGTANLIRRHLD